MICIPTSAAIPLQALRGYGQSVWFDYIRRSLIISGELQQMVANGEIWGVTSNPAIFEKAISGSTDYDTAIADRNFCTLGFLFGLHGWGAAFVIRQHGLLPWQARTEMVFVDDSETGAVFEQSVQLIFNGTLKVTLRRIVVQLNQPTRDGDSQIALLSNLPATQANALQIAALYQKRWRIECLFQVLEQCFRGEINTLAYPRAALFGFVMALICYNLLAVAQAAMCSVHGVDKIEASISPYYLADEVRRVYEGMMIAILPLQWQPFAQLDVDSTVQLLQQLAAQMDLSKFRSHPRRKKKSPNPNGNKTNLTSPLLDC
jgi:hypothetical protein